jgi:hypothetical protein
MNHKILATLFSDKANYQRVTAKVLSTVGKTMPFLLGMVYGIVLPTLGSFPSGDDLASTLRLSEVPG